MKKLLLVLALSLFVAPVFTDSEAVTKERTYTVKHVIDGATLELSNGEKIRLIGVDAPEVDTKMGQEATKFVKRFIEDRKVRFEYDVERRDKYGRLLAYAYVRRDVTNAKYRLWHKEGVNYVVHSNDRVYIETFLNAYVITQGYATPATIPPNVKYAELFQKLYQKAAENKRGLWKENILKEEALESKPISPHFFVKKYPKFREIRSNPAMAWAFLPDGTFTAVSCMTSTYSFEIEGTWKSVKNGQIAISGTTFNTRAQEKNSVSDIIESIEILNHPSDSQPQVKIKHKTEIKAFPNSQPQFEVKDFP